MTVLTMKGVHPDCLRCAAATYIDWLSRLLRWCASHELDAFMLNRWWIASPFRAQALAQDIDSVRVNRAPLRVFRAQLLEHWKAAGGYCRALFLITLVCSSTYHVEIANMHRCECLYMLNILLQDVAWSDVA